MPNWCENGFMAKGDTHELKRFIKLHMGYPAIYPPQIKGEKRAKPRKKYFCFNAFIKTPKNVIEMGYDAHEKLCREIVALAVEKGVNIFPIDGYNWNLLNGGVKWDIYRDEIDYKSITWEDKNLIHFSFDTAWGPPVRWFETIGKAFPKLEFRMNYWEPAMFFGGVLSAKNGEIEHRKLSDEECASVYEQYNAE